MQWHSDDREEADSVVDSLRCSHSLELRAVRAAVHFHSSAAKAVAGCTRMSAGLSMDKVRWQLVDQRAVVVKWKRLTCSLVPEVAQKEAVPKMMLAFDITL